jgi:CO/xanthine dehydrogenase Mo-binding subunit
MIKDATLPTAPRPAQVSGMIDGLDRVTGQVAYTINFELPGLLHAALLRSTAPHARIVRLDVSQARDLPGVALILTGDDVKRRGDVTAYYGPVFRDQPVLAIDKVRFVGEPVVAVLAEDPDVAQEALALVQVEYEHLPAVFNEVEALTDGAPLVHESPPTAGATFADLVISNDGMPNVCNHFKLRKGDVERGFAEADVVYEDTFSSPAVQHVPLETHACVAQVEHGRVTVWATTQTPHILRAQLAEMFRLPVSAVRVVVPTLGGAYGAKCYPKIEPLTAVLAHVARRPVRLHLTREEEFVTVTKARGYDQDEDGPDQRRSNSGTQEHLLLQHRCIRRHRPQADQEWRIRHRWPARHSQRVGRLVCRLYQRDTGRRLPWVRCVASRLGI